MDGRKFRESSTESSDGAADDAGVPRQRSSEESSSAESSSSESETERGMPVASQLKKAKVQDASFPRPVKVKTEKESQGKRKIRPDESGQESSPAIRKRLLYKSDSASRQEDRPKGNEQKSPAKKKNSGGKDENKPSKQTVQEAADPSSVKDLSLKLGKQIVQEAAVKDLSQKPGKKIQHTWSNKDEMVFANALLSVVKQGIDMHKSMYRIEQDIKDSMEFEYTRVQLAEKLKRLKRKYRNVMGKMKEGGFKENSFPFKSSHERNMFKISKQLWKEKPAAGEDLEMEEILPNEAGSVANPKVLAQGAGGAVADSGDSKERGGGGGGGGGGVAVTDNGDSKETDNHRAFIPESRDDGKKTRADAQAEMSALAGCLETQIKAARDRVQRGIRPSLALSIINDQRMDGMHFVKGFVSLDPAKTQVLEQKWREQKIAEMEVFSRRLDLLLEESKVCLEGLRSHPGHGKS